MQLEINNREISCSSVVQVFPFVNPLDGWNVIKENNTIQLENTKLERTEGSQITRCPSFLCCHHQLVQSNHPRKSKLITGFIIREILSNEQVMGPVLRKTPDETRLYSLLKSIIKSLTTSTQSMPPVPTSTKISGMAAHLDLQPPTNVRQVQRKQSNIFLIIYEVISLNSTEFFCIAKCCGGWWWWLKWLWLWWWTIL
jgi:hypothetical protein